MTFDNQKVILKTENSFLGTENDLLPACFFDDKLLAGPTEQLYLNYW